LTDGITLTNCTISGNSASLGGGLIASYGMATLTNCAVSSNSSGVSNGVGGGVDFFSHLLPERLA
jgi:hypothetical protein